jgi:hypothetical protein
MLENDRRKVQDPVDAALIANGLSRLEDVFDVAQDLLQQLLGVIERPVGVARRQGFELLEFCLVLTDVDAPHLQTNRYCPDSSGALTTEAG